MNPIALGLILLCVVIISILMMNNKQASILKVIGQVITRILISAVILYVLNIFGEHVDFQIAINPITASVVGILGLPGLAVLILIKLFILM